MIAQIYFDEPKIIRIFDRFGTVLADRFLAVPIEKVETLKYEADQIMKRLRMRRRNGWCKTEWGFEAKVRFI